MFFSLKQSKQRCFIIVGLIILTIAAGFGAKWLLDNKGKFFQNLQGPSLQQQPSDTQVATKVLPLHHWRTKKNIDVYFVPTEQPAIADVLVMFEAGAARDSNLSGLSKLMLGMIGEASQQLDANAIAEQFEQVGAIFSKGHTLDCSYLRLRSLVDSSLITKDKFNEMISLFAQVIAHPVFPQDSITRLKQQMLVSLNVEVEDPGQVGYQRFMQTIYANHPYANKISGTIAGIEQIKAEDLKRFHQEYYVANNATIVVVGSIHRDLAKEIGEKIAAVLPEGHAAEKLPEVLPLTNLNEEKVPFASKQSHIFWGQPGIAVGDPDYFALLLGNHILGGGQSSLLYKKVREERGLAYSVSSNFSGKSKSGPFLINLQTKAGQEQEALKVLRDTLHQFVKEGPMEEELNLGKQYLIGSFPLKFTSNSDILFAVSKLAFYKLPYDFLAEYTAAIDKVTAKDIVEAFNKKLQLDKMALVVVGDEQKR